MFRAEMGGPLVGPDLFDGPAIIACTLHPMAMVGFAQVLKTALLAARKPVVVHA